MKRTISVAVLLLVAGLVSPVQADAESAKATIEAEVGKIVTHLKDPAFKQLPKQDQVDKIRSIINAVFDYSELSRRTLGREWKEFNPEQQKEFEQLFGKLLESNYADRVLAYTSERIEFGKEIDLNQDKVEVESAIITADNKNIPINYRMLRKDSQWIVYDVVIEGISLVQNYRSQFREILAKQSPAELLAQLREKVNQ